MKLIVGLGNPGPEYEATRHNVGWWLVERLCAEEGAHLQLESKFKGKVATLNVAGCPLRALIPTTFMNLSGQAVGALARFYKIAPKDIIVAHDDLDLPVGSAKLKIDGGHGGNNGLRDIINHLGTRAFYRLRIGIGHPGHRDAVTPYVLGKPSKADKQLILDAIDDALRVFPYWLKDDPERAMQQLHTKTT